MLRLELHFIMLALRLGFVLDIALGLKFGLVNTNPKLKFGLVNSHEL